MAVWKLNPRHQVTLPSIQRRTEEMHRFVRDTIRAAEEHLLQSEAIVSQSAVVLDRARETLEMVKSSREQRHQDREAANSANKNNFPGGTH